MSKSTFSSASIANPSGFRPSLYDNKDEFILRVAPIGMAAIFFGAPAATAQDAGPVRQALLKLSFVYRHFLSPAGLQVEVRQQTATYAGNLSTRALKPLAEVLARQIAGIERVTFETLPKREAPGGEKEKIQLLLATDGTIHSRVTVAVRQGEVRLKGEVATAAQSQWAEQLAQLIAEGAVINELETGREPRPEVPGIQKMDDESLQALVLFRLALGGGERVVGLRVKAARAVVTLQGRVASESLRQRIESLARATLGVRELRSTVALID